MRRRLLVLAASVPLIACRGSFDPASYVNGLRVLSVQAEPPEIPPGQTSTLRALVVDTDGAAVELAWAACMLGPTPASAEPVNLDCIRSQAAPYLVPLGSGPMVQATMPDVPPTTFGLPDDTSGFYLPVRLVARAGGGQVTAVYRLRYGLGTPPNHNPALASVAFVAASPGPAPAELDESNPPVVHAGDVLTLRATFAPGSAETYTVLNPNPNDPSPTRQVTELLSVNWFATGGSLSEATTGEAKPDTKWRADKHLPTAGPEGAIIDLWIVGQDERGGADFTHRTLRLMNP